MGEIAFKRGVGFTKSWAIMQNRLRVGFVDCTDDLENPWRVTLTLRSRKRGVVGDYPLLRDAKAAAVAALGGGKP